MTNDTRERDSRLMAIARSLAGASRDTSLKVGCVIAQGGRMVGCGFNRVPVALPDAPPHEQMRANSATKAVAVEHAEMDAIYDAVNTGRGHLLRGGTAYVSCRPCCRCARAFCQLKLDRVVIDGGQEIPDHWRRECELAVSLLKVATIEVVELVGLP